MTLDAGHPTVTFTCRHCGAQAESPEVARKNCTPRRPKGWTVDGFCPECREAGRAAVDADVSRQQREDFEGRRARADLSEAGLL